MTPVYCQECNRANSAGARRCIWCGLPLLDKAAPERFEPTRVEIDYLDGIERLDNPTPVRLVINSEGLEVCEMMPGSRSIKIPATSLISATVVDGSVFVEGKQVRPKWWWVALGPFAALVPGNKAPDVKKYDYILSVKYRSGDEVRNAVFHREDRSGLVMLEGLARIITLLIRIRSGDHSGGNG